MQKQYVIGIDQSTQGSKALLFDKEGNLILRCDLPHKQIVNEKGWVSHDGEEIYQNIIRLIPTLIEKGGIQKEEIACVGISNQRETTIAYGLDGAPLAPAIVWQCFRAESVIKEIKKEKASIAKDLSEFVRVRTGIPMSPYFPAAKIAWLMKNVPKVQEAAEKNELHVGTIDSYLLYRLTKGKEFKTDYSNASRTQLLNLNTLEWDEEVCKLYDIPVSILPKICYSDSEFGETDFEGYFETPIPILSMMGDSHGALFGQGCHEKGLVKCTYGTGSSIMMNIGEKPILSKNGLVTSLAFGINGKVSYCLEGNLNYTGAVITWLKDDVQLIENSLETAELAAKANPADTTYLVPAFSGLGAPYWKSEAKAVLYGMSRTTGKCEIVKAALDCIAYQIADIVFAMQEDAGIAIESLRVDGGPTRNSYLMQFQSDMIKGEVRVSDTEELSGLGAAYLAGCKYGLYKAEDMLTNRKTISYQPSMQEVLRKEKYDGWLETIGKV